MIYHDQAVGMGQLHVTYLLPLRFILFAGSIDERFQIIYHVEAIRIDQRVVFVLRV